MELDLLLGRQTIEAENSFLLSSVETRSRAQSVICSCRE